MLRSYLPKGHALKHLELGSEPTPQAYVENMVKVFRLVRDCMADHATCWLNIGDTYSAGQRVGHGTRVNHKQSTNAGTLGFDDRPNAGESGNLCLIPQRLQIALADDGWIVRSIIVWHKPAPMPSSVQGWSWRRHRIKTEPSKRGRNKHAGGSGQKEQGERNGDAFDSKAEWIDCPGCPKCSSNDGLVLRRGSWRPTSSWEPVIMLAKSAKYFCDGEAVKTQAAEATIGRNLYSRMIDDPDEQFAAKHDHEYLTTTANLRDVWTIPAETLKEKHYAAFPTKLVENCLRAGTSAKGYCPTCGGPWVRVLEGTPETEAVRAAARNGKDWTSRATDNTDKIGENKHGNDFHAFRPCDQTIGWRPSCTCAPTEPRPGLVLDPFGGSGRTAITAQRLGLDSILCELNPDYVEMSRRIVRDDSPLFAFP